MRRLLPFAIAVLVLGFALLPVHAAEAPKPAGTKNPPPGTSVEMPILLAPMTEGGNLVSYAYISRIIVATSPSAAIDVRAKVPFIQDADVREVNGASIADNNSPDQVDKAALAARLLATARRVVGPGKVAEVRFTEIKVSPMRPPGEQPPSP